ncbi:MAG TPA: GspE/PulE family protein [bacterium]|nr:GspE/PulE family protein [bacterium]
MTTINDTIYLLNREEEERLTQEQAKKLKMPYVNLINYPLVKEVLDLISEEEVIQHQVVPYLKIGDSVRVATVDPESAKSFMQEKEKTLGLTLIPSLISKTSLYYGIAFYEKRRKDELARASQEKSVFSGINSIKITDIKGAAEAAKHSNTTELLETILLGAAKLNASDIHIEPSEKDFLTRFRIDGVLQDIVVLPKNQYKQLVSRIKYLSRLRMDVANQPQDGRFSEILEGEAIDFRVSIMPSNFGESIVLRLLGQEKSILKLDTLGFRSDALVSIRSAISKPHGMILTSGPTGSGKSSTLYAVLMELKKPGVKIITLEDPIEYRIEGIEQSQIRQDEEYGFVEALRASLRQDPDILMLGEVRDVETAEIAIQAALTGHLLLTTIHANSAPAVYARFLEIGVQPFLLSGSINLIMAQRLVRRICPKCRTASRVRTEVWQEAVKALRPIETRLPSYIQSLLSQESVELSHGKGCEQCGSTGYLGRQVIIEVIVPNEKIEMLVNRRATISEFEKTARELGMITMEQDGLVKAIMGITTIEEVWRVTRS